MIFTTPLLILGLASSAFAGVYITSPTADTVFKANEKATISWQDDKNAPLLKDFGLSVVSIYAGNALQQTELLQITSVDVGLDSSVEFVPPPSFGPDSNEYFVRIASVYLKDASNAQYPALAFSAKFKMAGMTGQFAPEVQSQIDGQSTAPVGPTDSQTSASKTGSSDASASTSAAKTANAAAASDVADTDGALSTIAGSSMMVIAAGAVLGALML